MRESQKINICGSLFFATTQPPNSNTSGEGILTGSSKAFVKVNLLQQTFFLITCIKHLTNVVNYS